jgi:hypothetical protein
MKARFICFLLVFGGTLGMQSGLSSSITTTEVTPPQGEQ